MPGVSPAALKAAATGSAGGSTFSTYLLLALIAVAAIGAGVLAARGSRRNRPGS